VGERSQGEGPGLLTAVGVLCGRARLVHVSRALRVRVATTTRTLHTCAANHQNKQTVYVYRCMPGCACVVEVYTRIRRIRSGGMLAVVVPTLLPMHARSTVTRVRSSRACMRELASCLCVPLPVLVDRTGWES
jgi:hypothetical protein